MESTIHIPSQKIQTKILFEQGLLTKEGSWIDRFKKITSHFSIITDHQVQKLYGFQLKEKLTSQACIVHLFSLPPGESSKNRSEKQRIENQMIKKGMGRESGVIALGGGVVTDLAGFIASTYCRGIPLFFIPTTLLGMVDAAIGGKVGVNTPYAKNQIGAFYHPHYILNDIDLLTTLSPSERRNGLSEIIKYALISSSSLFCKLQNEQFKWDTCDSLFLMEIIYQSCMIKKNIVETDPTEKNLRRILNFGHTIGHALETATAYTTSHGEAIAIGMIAESYLSFRMGYLSREDFLDICSLFQNYQFQLNLPDSITSSLLLEIMKRDKKAIAQTPRIVLLKKIGETQPFDHDYCISIDYEMLKDTLSWMISQFKRTVTHICVD